MAKKTVYQLTDDIDGRPLSEADAEAVMFSIDGRHYEIDLGKDNAASLRSALDQYIAVGRNASTRSTR